jgi:meso-butanediol dehydrogenase / (S,S)-butanediol dehydrogenase / diacetyl reductase
MSTRQIAVVTGAGSGIGRAIARELAGRGLTVVVTDLDAGLAAAVADELGTSSHRLDATDAAEATKTVQAVVEQHGALDVWVSNAGVSSMARFVDVTEREYDHNLNVNLRGPFVCGQAAARAMIALGRGGRIINTASMAGKQGRVPYLAHYVASKFGVVGLTQAMAFELAPHGILVNCVCPGFVATPMQDRELEWEAAIRGITPEEVKRLWVADTPLGRIEEPEDVARVVAFLAGPDAGFMTGEAVAINGGAFMD